MQRRIRWLITYQHPILLKHHDRHRRGVQTAGSITFLKDSESIVDVIGSKVSMVGFGDLRIEEGMHFQFLPESSTGEIASPLTSKESETHESLFPSSFAETCLPTLEEDRVSQLSSARSDTTTLNHPYSNGANSFLSLEDGSDTASGDGLPTDSRVEMSEAIHEAFKQDAGDDLEIPGVGEPGGQTDWIPSQEEIAARAQALWEEDGRPDGKAEEHWARAEAELRREANRFSAGKGR